MNPLRGIRQQVASWWANKPAWGSWSLLVPGPMNNRSGIRVDPNTALTLSAVYAAINVIATDLSSLPLKVFRKRKDGGRDEATDHPNAELLGVSPDGETTSLRWRQAVMGHVLGWGNGYSEIAWDSQGQPTGFYILDPAATCAERVPQNQRLFYRTTGNRTLPPYRVLHFAGLGHDGLKGYSPITLMREAVGLGLATQAFGATFFGNGTWPGLVLESPQKLSKEATSNLREQWESLHQGGDNSHRVAVLEMGMKASRVTISPEDAQFLETRKFQVVEIARIFRLPPHKIGDYSQSHLANIESSNLDYITTVLMPWCVMAEQEMNHKLFSQAERDAGYYCEHQMTALLRGDMAARGEFYSKMRDLGAMCPNEIRAKENLDPIDGGDIYLVPLNLTPLDMLEEKAQADLDKLKEPATPPDAQAPAESEPPTNGKAANGKAPRFGRFNPHHGEGGLFAAGGGGGSDKRPTLNDLSQEEVDKIATEAKTLKSYPPIKTAKGETIEVKVQTNPFHEKLNRIEEQKPFQVVTDVDGVRNDFAQFKTQAKAESYATAWHKALVKEEMPKKLRFERFNPHHGEGGLFAAGGGGGHHDGSGTGHDTGAAVDSITSGHDTSHLDAEGHGAVEEFKADAKAQIDDLKEGHDSTMKDMGREQKAELKGHERDQKAELKDVERGHAADLKAHDREAARDLAEHDREAKADGKDPVEAASDRQAFRDQQDHDRQALMEQHTQERKEILDRQAADRETFLAGQESDLEGQLKTNKDEMHDLMTTLKSDYADLIHEYSPG